MVVASPVLFLNLGTKKRHLKNKMTGISSIFEFQW